MAQVGRIMVLGGGIGGLSAAVALRTAGFHTEVFEQAPELREVGAELASGRMPWEAWTNLVSAMRFGEGPALFGSRLAPTPRDAPLLRSSSTTWGRTSRQPRVSWFGDPHCSVHWLAEYLARPSTRTAARFRSRLPTTECGCTSTVGE